MLQAMQGILAADPETQIVYGPDQRKFTAGFVDILYSDGRKDSPSCTIPILAWDELAQQLSQYHEGDLIQFVGRLDAKKDLSGNTVLSYTLKKIDESKTLVAETEKFLLEFTPAKARLSDQLKAAEQKKELNQEPQPPSPQL